MYFLLVGMFSSCCFNNSQKHIRELALSLIHNGQEHSFQNTLKVILWGSYRDIKPSDLIV